MTIEWLELQKQAHRVFADRIGRVTDWSAPTPDIDWDVHQLVEHVIDEQRSAPLLLVGRSAGEVRSRLQPLANDLTVEWERASSAALAAWDDADLQRAVQLSYDTVSAEEFLREQVADIVVHTWDLARALGCDERLDDDLVAAAWSVFEPQKDTLEASGLFASPVPVSDDAPLQSRLLALTGRDDRIAA